MALHKHVVYRELTPYNKERIADNRTGLLVLNYYDGVNLLDTSEIPQFCPIKPRNAYSEGLCPKKKSRG